MTRLLKTRILGLCCAMIALFGTLCASAAEIKPVVTMSLSSYQDVIASAKKIADLTGNAETFAEFESEFGKLNGMDISKPWGVVLFTDEEAFIPVVFIPITDLEEFQEQIPHISFLLDNFQEVSDTKYLLETQNGNFFLEMKNKWLTFYPEDHAKVVPADPAKLLDGLDKKYTLALNVNCENAPEELINVYLAPLELLMAFQNPDAAEQFANAKKQISRLLQEGKWFTYGLTADKRTGTITAEIEVAVKPGGSFAEGINYLKTGKSNYGGFYKPEEAFTFIGIGKLSEFDIEANTAVFDSQFETWIEEVEYQLEDEEERAELAVETLEGLRDILKASFATGKSDMAASWLTSGEVIFGLAIAEGDKLNDILKKTVEHLTESEPDAAEAFKLGYSSDLGYKWSRVTVPLEMLHLDDIPEELEDKAIELVLAIRKDSICGALGFNSKDIEAKLKKAINDSKTPIALPQQVAVASLPGIGQAVNSLGVLDSAPVVVKATISNLIRSSKTNKIIAEYTYPDGGKDSVITVAKITVPGSVISTIAKAVQAAQQAEMQEQLGADPFEGTDGGQRKAKVQDFEF